MEETKQQSLWGKLPLKTKIIIIGIAIGFVSILLFLLVIITPLMALGIINIEDIGGSGGNSGLGYATNTYLRQIGDECQTIIVAGEAYGLEDYVAGVISAEAYTSENIEALKAQAIAARTYAIARTNRCQKEIRNSSQDQNFTSKYNEKAIEAAEATKGLVLTYNSEIFSTQYDSFYTGGDYKCDSSSCSVTYKKEPNHEEHTVSVSSSRKGQIAGGHGYGMSQVASYEMAENGSTYNQILNYFYSPGVEIYSLFGSSSYTSGLSADATGFIKRTGPPVQDNEHDKKYYYSSNNLSYQGGYVGECTWYAYGRANEILNQSGSDLKWNYAPHAKKWLQANIDAGSEAFSYSTDVNNPKVGAIIVWGSDKFGHVAVVEAVNDDGTIDYSEANISTERSSSNPYGFRYQSHIPYNKDGVGTISKIWNDYTFSGYIYMIE